MIDGSVYPDLAHGEDFYDDADRADYVERICAAWDFGVVPRRAIFETFSGWREVFDLHPYAQSPAYHAFRAVFGWPQVTAPPLLVPCAWEVQDRREGRDDPCRLSA